MVVPDGTVVIVPLGDVTMSPFEVVPGEMAPLLLGETVMAPVESVVVVCGVVVV